MATQTSSISTSSSSSLKIDQIRAKLIIEETRKIEEMRKFNLESIIQYYKDKISKIQQEVRAYQLKEFKEEIKLSIDQYPTSICVSGLSLRSLNMKNK